MYKYKQGTLYRIGCIHLNSRTESLHQHRSFYVFFKCRQANRLLDMKLLELMLSGALVGSNTLEWSRSRSFPWPLFQSTSPHWISRNKNACEGVQRNDISLVTQCNVSNTLINLTYWQDPFKCSSAAIHVPALESDSVIAVNKLKMDKECVLYLLDMKEIFGFEWHSSPMNRRIIIFVAIISNVCPHSKCHWFWLNRQHRNK